MMIEYKPVTTRQDFLKKWLKIRTSGTTLTVEHLYQLTLDVFASRQGEDWRNCEPDSSEQLKHPNGQYIEVDFEVDVDKAMRRPTFNANVRIYPDIPDEVDFNYKKAYTFKKTEEGIVVFEADPETDEVREVELDPPTCAQLYRDIMRANIYTYQHPTPFW